MKRLFLIVAGVVLAFAFPAMADPGPADEVEVIVGDCDDGTTIVRAHNTQDRELGYLIRIDGRLVEQGRLAPGERVSETYEVDLGESHFYRIRLGVQGDGIYFSTEGATDRTNCPSPSESPPPSSPPPSSPPPSSPPPSSPPPGGGGGSTTTPPPTVGGGGGSTTPPPSVLGGSGTNTTSPGPLAFTGPADLPWLLAAMMALLLAGTFALRFGSRSRSARRSDSSV
ncbi:MAG: hypothetical protein ACRDG8_03075 [Actinomycetota bacterium]